MVNFKNKAFNERSDHDATDTHKAIVNEKPTLINYVSAIFAYAPLPIADGPELPLANQN